MTEDEVTFLTALIDTNIRLMVRKFSRFASEGNYSTVEIAVAAAVIAAVHAEAVRRIHGEETFNDLNKVVGEYANDAVAHVWGDGGELS